MEINGNFQMVRKMLHVVMYPWFAYGHMIPYIHLANELAKRGHKITYILPIKAKLRLQPLILDPILVTLRTINVPHVPPLPVGTENATDVPDLSLHTYLATAFDRTRPEFESIVSGLGSDVVLYDLAYWVPQVAERVGNKFKAVCYNVVSAHSMNFTRRHSKSGPKNLSTCPEDGLNLPTSRYTQPKEQKSVDDPLGEGLSVLDRLKAMLNNCDAIAFRTCREVEGEDCEDLSNEYGKPMLLTGPVIPESTDGVELEPKWASWLAGFEAGSVLFCAFGSQFSLDKAQFQEILIGFEMTKMPFFLALMPPKGCSTVEEAYPEGFEERVKRRGVVTSEWVQQFLILAHSSVGCFVNHCGFGTMWESLLSKNQIVLIPQLGDQVLNAKMLVDKMKVGVEVKRGNDGWVSKENLCDAIISVMDDKSEICGLVKKNHQIWGDKLGAPRFMDDYIDNFIKDIQILLE